LIGNQIRTIDPILSLDKYKLYDYKKGINDSRKIYTDVLRNYNKLVSPNKNDESVLKDAHERSLKSINGIINEIRKDRDALITLGIEDANKQMYTLIKDKGFDVDVRDAVVKNKKVRLTKEGKIE